MTKRDDDDELTAQRGAPGGVTLFDHAEISAALAEGDHTEAEILEARGLSAATWQEASLFWMQRMGDDVRDHAEKARMPLVYSDAFSAAQDGLKPLPPMDAEGYAALTADVLRAGGPAEPLARRGLSQADFLRLGRHFARVLSTDPAENKVFQEAFERLMGG